MPNQVRLVDRNRERGDRIGCDLRTACGRNGKGVCTRSRSGISPSSAAATSSSASHNAANREHEYQHSANASPRTPPRRDSKEDKQRKNGGSIRFPAIDMRPRQ
jgi:hypothetical protein